MIYHFCPPTKEEFFSILKYLNPEEKLNILEQLNLELKKEIYSEDERKIFEKTKKYLEWKKKII